MTSRSFGRPVVERAEMREAIATHTARGAEKLREEGSVAGWIQPFIMTSPHREDQTFYGNHAHIVLPQPTDYTPMLLDYALKGLEAIFKEGFFYKKAGVLLGGISPKDSFQQDLFVAQIREKEAKQEALMTLLDRANNTFGYDILQFAAEGTERRWQTQKNLRSPCYTTRWQELLTIRI